MMTSTRAHDRRRPPRSQEGGAAARGRTCVSCRASAEQSQLVRLIALDDGAVIVDLAGGAHGRGAWVHPSVACLEGAQRGLSRSFERAVRCTGAELLAQVRAAATRRAVGLLLAAGRGRRVAIGGTALDDLHLAGHVALVVVASDARAALSSRAVERAVAAGRAAVFGTKAELGKVFGRDEVAVLGVRDAGLARALAECAALVALGSAPSVQVGSPEDG